ncbi:hypothetical protein F5Y11DRAFT_325434, partial [Daldinia sp. FL1419]
MEPGQLLGDRDMVFLVAAMPYIALVYITWRDRTATFTEEGDRIYYYVSPYDSLDLCDLEWFKAFETRFSKIRDWAKGNRLRRIEDGLKKWETHGRPSCESWPTIL